VAKIIPTKKYGKVFLGGKKYKKNLPARWRLTRDMVWCDLIEIFCLVMEYHPGKKMTGNYIIARSA
jgi:hypothetical protein